MQTLDWKICYGHIWFTWQLQRLILLVVWLQQTRNGLLSTKQKADSLVWDVECSHEGPGTEFNLLFFLMQSWHGSHLEDFDLLSIYMGVKTIENLYVEKWCMRSCEARATTWSMYFVTFAWMALDAGRKTWSIVERNQDDGTTFQKFITLFTVLFLRHYHHIISPHHLTSASAYNYNLQKML